MAGALEQCSSSAKHAELYRYVLDTVEADGSKVDLRAQPGDIGVHPGTTPSGDRARAPETKK